MRVLNLYAGLGGNRKLWTEVEVTATFWATSLLYTDAILSISGAMSSLMTWPISECSVGCLSNWTVAFVWSVGNGRSGDGQVIAIGPLWRDEWCRRFR